MDNPEVRRSSDDAWILKYRTALDLHPTPPSRAQKLRELMGSAYSIVGKFIEHWTYELERKRPPTAKFSPQKKIDSVASSVIAKSPQQVKKAS